MIGTFEKFLEYSALVESQQMQRFSGNKSAGKRTKDEEEEWAKGSDFNFTFKQQGTTFDPSIHSSSQARDRRPEFSKEDWKKLHRKVFWHIKDNKLKDGTYLFYNEQMQQGYVALVKRNGGEVRIITVLPKGRYDPNMGSSGKTDLALVEEINQALTNEGMVFESVDRMQIVFV